MKEYELGKQLRDILGYSVIKNRNIRNAHYRGPTNQQIINAFKGLFTAQNPSGGGGFFFQSYEEMSYEEFRDLRDNARLIPGSLYYLHNFVTVYDQPDYQANGTAKESVETKTGAVHPIIVRAISTEHISDVAFQPDFPNDRIRYDWTFDRTEVMDEPAKGRIIERIDQWGNRTDYDHREALFKRYESSTGSGVFNSYKDNGEASQEFLTFNDLGNTVTGNIIGTSYDPEYFTIPFLLSGNVFNGDAIYSNILKSGCSNNTFGSDTRYNNLNSNIISCIFGAGLRDNSFEEGANGCTFPTSVLSNIFETIVTDLDLSSATLIKGNYSKRIIKNSAGVLKLTYIDGSGVLQVADITD